MNPLTQAGEALAGSGAAGMTEPQHYAQYALTLLLATLSGALLAYHPVQRGEAATLDDLEQRKTVILYGAIGALIAIICDVNPSMAFVIFGIGGLMRFRTDVGASKRTGHVIMATLIGLCWGLGLWPVAALATVFFWVMIYALDAAKVRELLIGGVTIVDMPRAAEAYRAAIMRAGGQVLGHNKLFSKSQMSFVVRMQKGNSFERVMTEIETIPDALRGAPDWPS